MNDGAAALADGAASYCRKPCPPEKLEEEIDRVLARGGTMS
jgi:DNA-binding NarL/FixJ family response regulator